MLFYTETTYQTFLCIDFTLTIYNQKDYVDFCEGVLYCNPKAKRCYGESI